MQTLAAESLSGSATELEQLNVVDVRTPAEYREVHATVAKNVPLDQLADHLQPLTQNASEANPIYLLCKTGGRAKKAATMLAESGCDDTVVIEGGTEAWLAAGLPVVRGKRSIALDRQVRIAAGSLVLVGIVLGLFVHPAAFGLSAFIGAGLVFSGVTDTCGMGMMLSKMPWNR